MENFKNKYMSTHVCSKEFFSIHSHKNLESHRLVGRQEVFQFLYYFYHVWLSCNIIRCGSLKCHKFVTYAQGKKKTKNFVEDEHSHFFSPNFTTATNDGELELPIETRTPSIANVHNVGGKIPRGVARRSLFFTRHQ